MSTSLSRRKIAHYVVNAIESKSSREALREVAAYLVQSRRTRELDLIVRSIEDELQARGVVVARVASAYELSAELKRSLTKLIDAKELHLVESIDPTLIGGVAIQLPDGRIDTTLKRKLMALDAAKQ